MIRNWKFSPSQTICDQVYLRFDPARLEMVCIMRNNETNSSSFSYF